MRCSVKNNHVGISLINTKIMSTACTTAGAWTQNSVRQKWNDFVPENNTKPFQKNIERSSVVKVNRFALKSSCRPFLHTTTPHHPIWVFHFLWNWPQNVSLLRQKSGKTVCQWSISENKKSQQHQFAPFELQNQQTLQYKKVFWKRAHPHHTPPKSKAPTPSHKQKYQVQIVRRTSIADCFTFELL